VADPVAEKPSRGTVTPGQLKSRLENLKRLSIKDEVENEDTVDEAEAGDVEPVDAVCSPKAAPTRTKRSSSVTPMCCTIH